MLWVIIALLSGLSRAFMNVVAKKTIRLSDEYVTVFSQTLFASVILFFFLLYRGIPEIKQPYYLAVVVFSTVIGFAAILYMKSIKYADLSKSVPMLALTPVFLIPIGFLINKEMPNLYGIIGILLIFAGAYGLNFEKRKQGILYPFKELIVNKGSRYMLIVSFLWAITASMGKVGIVNSSPTFFTTTGIFGSSIVLLPFLLVKSKNILPKIKHNLKGLFFVGFFHGLQELLSSIAVTLTLVSYAIAVKRMNLLFSIILGFLFFKEKGFKQSMVAGSLMVLGVIVIGVLG